MIRNPVRQSSTAERLSELEQPAVQPSCCRHVCVSGLRLTVLAFLGMFALVHVDCTRYLLQTFIPKGLDSCTSYVQSTCTLGTKAAPQADTCSQQNAKQLAADVSSADNDQVGLCWQAAIFL